MTEFNDRVKRLDVPQRVIDHVQYLDEEGCDIIISEKAIFWNQTSWRTEPPLDITNIVLGHEGDSSSLLDKMLKHAESITCPVCESCYDDIVIITFQPEDIRFSNYRGAERLCQDCLEQYQEEQLDVYERYGLNRGDF